MEIIPRNSVEKNQVYKDLSGNLIGLYQVSEEGSSPVT
jgi:hypothetical protein